MLNLGTCKAHVEFAAYAKDKVIVYPGAGYVNQWKFVETWENILSKVLCESWKFSIFFLLNGGFFDFI